ncbi:MAG: MFS transporter [Polyangiaceae bacterium]|nr:MFS transporter [Polyangiaceae bacterium]
MPSSSLHALLSNRRYVLYLASRLSLVIATQMLSVAVGLQIYEITHDPLRLGVSGLAQFLPIVLLTLPGGHVADLRDRRKILLVCLLGFATAAVLLGLMAYANIRRVAPIYAVLVVIGAIRAFSAPASQALMPNLVHRNELERGVALSSSAWQLAMIVGPALAGVLYARTKGATFVYFACTAMALIAFATMFAIGHFRFDAISSLAAAVRSSDGAVRRRVRVLPAHAPPAASNSRQLESGLAKRAAARPPASFATVLAGIRYIWSNKPILGAISLDLFAVLLGGAVALLPIYARDILHVGAEGFGMLRSAPAVGAATMAFLLAYVPLRRHAGSVMLGGVALFGIATIVFGVSTNFRLSLVALFVLGASDMVSVVIRSSLIQIRTPDEMRGRVGAVNQVFIGASNELGEFESGVTAKFLGPELAVVVGGIGTCLVVVTWAIKFPELRKVDRLTADIQN